MEKFLICAEKQIRKYIGVEAKNDEEAKEKVVQLINKGKINFDDYDKENITFELASIYPKCMEKMFKKYLDSEMKKRKKVFDNIKENFYEMDKNLIEKQED